MDKIQAEIYMRINSKKIIGLILCITMVMAGMTSCGPQEDPTVVTFWHVYGAQTESPMNDMVAKFNKTVGKDENIRVKVTSIGSNNSVHNDILESAYGYPGANEMPDMFIAYPKTIMEMPDKNVLVDYMDVLSKEEMDNFIPSFLEEGIVDGKQLVLPLAKSTEILYLNKAVFDKFASETGATIDELKTWEGLFGLCKKYYEWTDDQTPNVENDGKAFFAYDDHINYFQTAIGSLGGEFFDKKGNVKYGKEFNRAWNEYSKAAIKGGMWLENGYATEPFRTGDAICCVASSASVMYFADKVTYSNNTEDEMKIVSMPLPTFKGGENMVIQRGAGICTVKSTPEKEKACQTFIKWITEKDNNVELVTKLGYIPVTYEAYDQLPEAINGIKNSRYKSLYNAVMETNKDYKFFVAPQFKGYLEFESKFEDEIRSIMKEGESSYDRGQSFEGARSKCLARIKRIR